MCMSCACYVTLIINLHFIFTVIHEQLSEYFVTNNFFGLQQYRFRKTSSTEFAELELIDKLLIQLDSIYNRYSTTNYRWTSPTKILPNCRHIDLQLGWN